jgi:hypothetical protein
MSGKLAPSYPHHAETSIRSCRQIPCGKNDLASMMVGDSRLRPSSSIVTALPPGPGAGNT